MGEAHGFDLKIDFRGSRDLFTAERGGLGVESPFKTEGKNDKK